MCMSVKLFTPACSLCSIIMCHSSKLKKKTLSLQNYSFVLFAGLQAKALCSSFMHGHTPTHTHSSSGTICDRGTLITTLGNKVRRDGHIGPGGRCVKGKEGCLGKSHYALWPTLRKNTHLNLQGSFVQPSHTVVRSILNMAILNICSRRGLELPVSLPTNMCFHMTSVMARVN